MTTATDLTGQAQTYYQFDDNGNLTRKQLGNGVYTERAYDQANRLISLHTRKSDGSTPTYFGYDYCANNQLIAVVAVG